MWAGRGQVVPYRLVILENAVDGFLFFWQIQRVQVYFVHVSNNNDSLEGREALIGWSDSEVERVVEAGHELLLCKESPFYAGADDSFGCGWDKKRYVTAGVVML